MAAGFWRACRLGLPNENLSHSTRVTKLNKLWELFCVMGRTMHLRRFQSALCGVRVGAYDGGLAERAACGRVEYSARGPFVQ